ncbi:hypothetical protein HanXRQr2_Chr13g0568141 [Helianthus annuus]|uniref:Uncharacterized protein n=1 Tax=Helianthus annuus TaxID=4232 RepID=A0A251SN97_HELAN|nr:hypothetical protein HanXRQr2_Chr13g0568141 [Helianthus annuus]
MLVLKGGMKLNQPTTATPFSPNLPSLFFSSQRALPESFRRRLDLKLLVQI